MRHHTTLTLTLLCLMLGTVARADDAPRPTVEELVSSLGDKRYRTREKATKALIAMGPPVLVRVRKLLEHENLEVARRAGRIVESIERVQRWKKVVGGKPVAGLQLTIRSYKQRYVSGQQPRFQLEIKNVGKVARQVPRIKDLLRYLDCTSPRSRRSSSMSCGHLRLKRRGNTLRQYPYRGKRRQPSVTRQTLEPGKSATRIVTIAELVSSMPNLQSGTYEMELSLYTKTQKLIAGAASDLTSNKVVFELK